MSRILSCFRIEPRKQNAIHGPIKRRSIARYLLSCQIEIKFKRNSHFRRSCQSTMATSTPKIEISIEVTFVSNTFSACWVEICTIPIDIAKVRLQLYEKQTTREKPKYRGIFGTLSTIAREEGIASLWRGIVPGLHRQCLFGGLRIGLYEPIKNLYVERDFVGDVPIIHENSCSSYNRSFGNYCG